MISKLVFPVIILSLLSGITSRVTALEYIVTSSVGGYNTPLNNTTNKLDLGDNPVAKTVYVYMKYSQAEALQINVPNGGLQGGSFKLTFGSATVAGVNSALDITRGPSNTLAWTVFTPTVAPTTTTPQAIFNQGLAGTLLNVIDPGAGNFGYYIIGQVLISPGSTINPTGTTVTVAKVGGASWSYFDTSGNPQVLAVSPSTFQFTVVPEASTIAMGLVSVVSLVSTGLYRRRVAKNPKSAL